MCGIIGIWAKNNKGEQEIACLEPALKAINHRGPDHQACKLYSNFGFAHARLSIIDTDSRSNQPFTIDEERFTLVFNGEIYNYQPLRVELEADGVIFTTESDTEVLIKLLITHGVEAIERLDGFFAFAFYDRDEDYLLLARDRMGIKPLLIYEDKDKLVFSSEMDAFNAFEIDKSLDSDAINYYFGLTYTPAPKTIFSQVRKLKPGTFLAVKKGVLTEGAFYKVRSEKSDLNYAEAQFELRSILTESVANRMVADVPLGCFLSGGLDSSIIAALAIQNNPNLRTFSIGFDHAYFSETDYADKLAERIGSKHTNFVLSKEDFRNNFQNFLTSIDEPFADSSAFAVYLLSQKTRQEVTVALSGDGADELFGGYRKHMAEFQVQSMSTLKRAGIKTTAKIAKQFRSNRSDKIGELNRKLQKLEKGFGLSFEERYWSWCQFIDSDERKKLLKQDFMSLDNPLELDWNQLNDMLLADQLLVLPNDMLKKVDLMSMAASLEVRTPFLDHKLVDFANSLPISYKITNKGGKRILKDAFADLLPDEILSRSKKGFEIPIKEWLGDEIDIIFNGPLFSPDYIADQGLFNYGYIQELQAKWGDSGFGDRIYMVWALIVFQYWWNRNFQ